MAQSNHQTRKGFAGIVIAIIAALVAAAGITTTVIVVNEHNKAPEAIIEYSEDQNKDAKTTLQNSTEKVDVPSVESVDTNKPVTDSSKEDEDHGQGAWYNIDITTPATVKDSTLGRCINVDGWYGAQCWDLSAAISETQTGRKFSTCGTGAASGMMNCWQQNAGSEYDVIWDAGQIRPGDILVFGGGQYGHTGVAMGYNNNGYVTLLGQNQGGGWCDQGGSSTNIINMSLGTFKGAYRWKGWNHLYEVKPAPAQEQTKTTTTPTVTDPCAVGSTIKVVKGDTMGKIMKRCTGNVKWGSAMNAYAQTWVSTVKKPGQTVYAGWTYYPGVGLWAGDVIKRVE